MSWTKARLLASSWSGATLGSFAATGRVAGMSPRITPVGLPLVSRIMEPLTNSVRVRRVRFNPQSLQGPAVQENLIVRLLERYGIVRRDLVQLFAREGLGIVRELLMRPAADVIDPFAGPIGFDPRA